MGQIQAGAKPLPEGLLKAVTFGFGTATAMWTIAYVCRLPEISAPGQLVVALFAVCAIVGGALAGCFSGGVSPLSSNQSSFVGQASSLSAQNLSNRAKAGFFSGVVTAILNMLILGSILVDKNSRTVNPSALIWIPCFIITGGITGATGAAIGSFLPQKTDRAANINWTSAFMAVAAASTLVLIAVGGMVTSMKAGLAVTDWPNSFGSNMFLYPFSRMTGGIYFEHTHRLFGSLVGLATIFFIIIIFKSDNRKAVRTAALLSLPFVGIQGLLGGLRVTGVLTLSASPSVMRPSIILAVAHGVTGQLYFAFVVALMAATSDYWLKGEKPIKNTSAASVRNWSAALVCAILAQLLLGAILRHMGQKPLAHISFSVVPAMLAFACGFRAWGVAGNPAPVRKTGLLLVILTVVQFCLGMMTYITLGATSGYATRPFAAVVAVTVHQVCGAMFFATAVALAMFNFRFFEAPKNSIKRPK